ncbi:uncharacterized protein LOC107266896 [Cephus cinctus]|uniref:Uncharacterized protein LOC107266896 n=1 Tax=Cephus cinctus TaxID=211228 RepID=A0AAJ7BSQ2_CEPCN|nr:uncharacterized protein LOC107266896 [Cephus cinctus]
MSDEYSRAISFANSYFALVDGLATGLEDHLADDVILDWFGETIKGRANVTAFMKAHKFDSRHMFTNITPTASIGYRKKRQCNRDSTGSSDKIGCITECVIKNELNFDKLRISDKDRAINVNEESTYDLDENDLSALFKLEITSTNIDEIEDNISKIRREECAGTLVKQECGQGDGPGLVEQSSVKYLEANGEIEFSKKFIKKNSFHTWARPCRLQIAYSVMPEKSSGKFVEAEPKVHEVESYDDKKSRLPSLEEINEIGSRLVPNLNSFGGYLRHVDFTEERQHFLKTLADEFIRQSSGVNPFTPQYVGNRLVFDKIGTSADGQKNFVFNYLIHLLIYEGSNRCRLNLSHEFEKRV